MICVCVYTLYISYVSVSVAVSMCIQIIRALLLCLETHTIFFAVCAALFALPLCGRLAAVRKNFLDFPPKSTHTHTHTQSVEIMPKLCSCSCGIVILKINRAATLLPSSLTLSLSLSASLACSRSLSVVQRSCALSCLCRAFYTRAANRGGETGAGTGRRQGACHSIVMCEARSC